MEVHSSYQIIEYLPDGTITLDEEILRSFLTRDEIKNRYVSIISVAGACRQGKSFILNFLLRYLQIKYIEKRDVSDWLKPEDGPVHGFSWAAGSTRHTNGIHMWPEIFLTTIPSGEDIAIILLDTQGSFDNQSTMNDCAKIFALSTLISSMQIYNVMRGIKQYDLTHLQLFGGYGNLLTNSNSDVTHPFQELCFLVRDWPAAFEHPYGNIGGSAHLESVFNSENPEVKEQVDNVKKLFSKISCFLLPYPGQAVDSSNSFQGNLDDIVELFKQHVQDFVPMWLCPEQLILKTINGQKIKAEELMIYIIEYSKVLKEGKLPTVETIFKTTVKAHYMTVSFEAFNLYKEKMDKDVIYDSDCTPDDLYTKHSSYKEESLNYFDQRKQFNDETVYYKYFVELERNMEKEFKRYRKLHTEKLRQREEEKKIMDELILQSKINEEKLRLQDEQIRSTRTVQLIVGGLSILCGSAVALAPGLIGTALGVSLEVGAVSVVSGVTMLALGVKKLANYIKPDK